MKKSWTLTSNSRTDPGKVRKHNEDACITRDDIGVWVVADGMGGHHAGEVASGMIVEAIGKLGRYEKLADLADRVEDTLEDVNTQLMDMSRESKQTIGSTVVSLISDGRYAMTLWAGDSRVYRLRGRKFEMLTQDHALSEDLIESQLLSREEAEAHPQGERVTRAVGGIDEFFMDAEVYELKKGDLFILCSDGLYKELSDEEIEAFAKGAKDRSALANGLVEQALTRRARDNVTVLCVDVQRG